MKRRLSALAVAALTALLTPSAMAQADDAFEAAAHETEVAQRPPVAVLIITAARVNTVQSYSFYGYWAGDRTGASREGEWAYAVRWADSVTGDIFWADSGDCSTLKPLLEKLEVLPLPRAEIAGLGVEPDALTVSFDGAGYQLWVRGGIWPNGFLGSEFYIGASSGSPLAEWAGPLRSDFGSCWRVTQPAT